MKRKLGFKYHKDAWHKGFDINKIKSKGEECCKEMETRGWAVMGGLLRGGRM